MEKGLNRTKIPKFLIFSKYAKFYVFEITWSKDMWTVLLSLGICHLLYVVNFHIYIFSTETIEPNKSKHSWDGALVVFFQYCVPQPSLQSRWQLLVNKEFSLIDYYCFIVKMSSNLCCSCMTMSSSTHITGF